MTTSTTTQELQICRIKFPEIKLQTRDAHKLRGYFGNLFKQQSPILHNHYEDGRFRYKYPSVQYKIINKVPTLIG
ncbi:MAG: DNA repair protein, partial [Mesonia sp.]|nr:DNA repair protein [Mesonia sp.]